MDKIKVAVFNNNKININDCEAITLSTEDIPKAYLVDFNAVYTGYIDSADNAEKIKKFIIEKKINGAFILVRLNLISNGELYKDFDNTYIKKIKELCLFADLISFSYNEACLFANINNINEWDIKDIDKMIFRINSLGMANKLVISHFPVKEAGKCTVISEYGECEILKNDVKPEKRDAFCCEIIKEIINGINLTIAVENALKSI